MPKLLVVFLSALVLPLLCLAQTNEVTGQITGVQLTAVSGHPEYGGGQVTFFNSSGGYRLSTSQKRIQEPMVRFWYFFEEADTTRRLSVSNLPYGEEKDIKLAGSKTWSNFRLYQAGPKAKLLVWRVELLLKNQLLDFKTNATEAKLKQYGIDANWWEKK